MGILGKAIIGHAVVKHAVKSANKPSFLDQVEEFGQNMQDAAVGIDSLQERIREKQLRKLEKKQAKLNKEKAKIEQKSAAGIEENDVANERQKGNNEESENIELPEMPEMPDFSNFMEGMRKYMKGKTVTKHKDGKTVKYEFSSSSSMANDDKENKTTQKKTKQEGIKVKKVHGNTSTNLVKEAIDKRIAEGIEKAPWGKIIMVVLILIALISLISFCYATFIERPKLEEAKRAECASMDGTYGGGKCYVDGHGM